MRWQLTWNKTTWYICAKSWNIWFLRMFGAYKHNRAPNRKGKEETYTSYFWTQPTLLDLSLVHSSRQPSASEKKINYLHHQSHLWCSSHTQEPKPIVWWRSFLCTLSNRRNTESCLHQLQCKFVRKPLQLETQPGPKTTDNISRRKENDQQCSPSPNAWTPKHNLVHKIRTTPK